MTHRIPTMTTGRHQHGAVLFVALVFLILITLLALTATGTSILQEKMTGGMIPGLPPAISGTINDAIKQAYTPAPWHRGAWKELLDLQ